MNTEIACDQVASPAVDRCRDRRNICRPVANQSERKPNLSSTSFHMKLQSSVSNLAFLVISSEWTPTKHCYHSHKFKVNPCFMETNQRSLRAWNPLGIRGQTRKGWRVNTDVDKQETGPRNTSHFIRWIGSQHMVLGSDLCQDIQRLWKRIFWPCANLGRWWVQFLAAVKALSGCCTCFKGDIWRRK